MIYMIEKRTISKSDLKNLCEDKGWIAGKTAEEIIESSSWGPVHLTPWRVILLAYRIAGNTDNPELLQEIANSLCGIMKTEIRTFDHDYVLFRMDLYRGGINADSIHDCYKTLEDPHRRNLLQDPAIGDRHVKLTVEECLDFIWFTGAGHSARTSGGYSVFIASKEQGGRWLV
jgi:hypothetical protein